MAGKKKPKKPKKKHPGRQSDITEGRVRVLVKAIGSGLPKVHAASLARISHRCLNKWELLGSQAFEEAGEDEARVPKNRRLHVRLVLGIRKAIADTMQEALDNIHAAGEKHWQADAWLLSRLCPSRFADQRREFADLKKQCAELLAEVVRLRNMPAVPRAEAPQSEADQKAGAAVVIPAIPTAVPVAPELVSDSVNVQTPTIEGGFLPVGV